MEKAELPGSTSHVPEHHLTDTDTDVDVVTSQSSDSDTISDETPTDPSQVAEENPFVPPPPYEEIYKPNERNLPQAQPVPRVNKLATPIAIPATSKKLGSPFLRAYPPCLQEYNLSADEFLKFLDELNRATVQSPPFQVLGLAGMIVGYVPLGGINSIVSAATQVGARVGAAAVSKGRTEMMMRDANRNIFTPRGLKCEIAKLSALAKIANIPILDEEGKVSESANLLPRIEPDHDEHKHDSGEAGKNLIMQRRLDAFYGYIAPLELDGLPELATSNNFMGKWHTHASERDRAKAERRLAKKAHKADHKQPTEERIASKHEKKLAKETRKLDKVVAKDGLDSRKAQKEMAKLERKQHKLESEYDKRLEKASKDDDTKKQRQSKVEKRIRKGLWLIIREFEPGDATS